MRAGQILKMELIKTENREHKVYSLSKNVFSSLVLNTGVSDCSLKCASLDQTGMLSSSANAKNGTSFSSEINCDAFNLDSSEGETNSMILGRRDNLCSNFSLVILDLEHMTLEYFLSSFNNALGEYNSTAYELINSAVYDSALNNDRTTLVSTTNFILAQDLEDSSMLSFNFFPNFKQSLSESLELSNPSLNSSNASSCFILLANASLANEDQLSHSNLSILCLNSFGTDKVNDGIFTSYTYNTCYMCDNTCLLYKDFGLEQITKIYSDFNKRKKIYLLDKNNKLITNSSRFCVASIDNVGNMFLKGTKAEDQGFAMVATTNLEIKNSSGSLMAFFDNKGNLKLNGSLYESWANP